LIVLCVEDIIKRSVIDIVLADGWDEPLAAVGARSLKVRRALSVSILGMRCLRQFYTSTLRLPPLLFKAIPEAIPELRVLDRQRVYLSFLTLEFLGRTLGCFLRLHLRLQGL
jgi:hypothetical protein